MLEVLSTPTDAVPRSPVRCSLCNLPVVRSLTDPPVLLHQTLNQHGGGGDAVDFFLADGPCPQEGTAIPPEAVTLLRPASGWVA